MTITATRRVGVGDVVITERAKQNVLAALDANRLTYGPWTRQFERRFADLHDRRFACFVNSGTDALRIGLAAMKEAHGWEDGAEVLVPALTFVASVNVIVQNGLVPLFVDVDEFYGMDADRVAHRLGRRSADGLAQPVAMMPVHLFGQPANPLLHLVADAFGVKVIADSCETMFAPGCAAGEVSCFSTFACHVIQTGVGGIATTNDPQIAALIRSYANHGRSGVYAGIDDALGVKETMDARFHFDRMGYSSRATEMEAAIGCAELDDWERNVARRAHIATRLTSGLERLPLRLPRVRDGGSSVWMMYPVLADDRATRDRLVQHLEAEGVETRQMLPLTNQPYFKARWGDIEAEFPNARRANETGFYVGCHPYMSDADVAQVLEAFHGFSYWRNS